MYTHTRRRLGQQNSHLDTSHAIRHARVCVFCMDALHLARYDRAQILRNFNHLELSMFVIEN